MKKKNLGLCLSVLIFVVSTGSPAAVPRIEHLAWASTPWGDVAAYTVDFSPTNVLTTFLSDPLLTFSIPGSKKGSELFMEVQASMLHSWSGDVPRRMSGNVRVEIVSPLIPAGVYVQGGLGVGEYISNNAAEAGLTGSTRSSRYANLPLRAGHLDFWGVGYTSTGDPYPDAIPLLESLLAAGFEVRVYAQGTVRGVSHINYLDITVHVTRAAS